LRGVERANPRDEETVTKAPGDYLGGGVGRENDIGEKLGEFGGESVRLVERIWRR